MVEIIRLESAGSTLPTFSIVGEQSRGLPGSTGDRSGDGSGGLVQVRLRRARVTLLDELEMSDDRATSLRTTFEAVRAIASDSGWTLLRGTAVHDGCPKLEVASSEDRSFLLVSVVIRTDHGCLLVADAGTIRSDARSLELISRDDLAAFDESDLARLKGFATRNLARWRAKDLDRYRMVSVARQPFDVLRDVAAYRCLLAGGIDRLFGGGVARV